MKNLCNSQAHCVVTKGCEKVISCRIGIFRYEMIGETQPELGLYEIVSFIYPAATKI